MAVPLPRRHRVVAAVLASALIAGGAVASAGAAEEPQARSKIYGGRQDTRSDVKWIGAVRRHPRTSNANGTDRQYCAGTLVTRRWLLSAAHCFVNEDGSIIRPREIEVLLAEKNLLASRSRSRGEFLDVTRVVVHPSYDPESSRWDAALLRLSRSTRTNPIRIIGTSERRFWPVGKRAYIAGWGDREPADSPVVDKPDRLHSGFIPVVGDATCRAHQDVPAFYQPSMFCAGYSRGRPDTCAGDSGGPIAVKPSDGKWRLIGITSFGLCGSHDYGVYTRLTSSTFRNWYRRTIAG